MELSCTVQHVLPPGEDTPWFDVNGLPLWWQVPLGVLHDLLAAGQKPWRLTVFLYYQCHQDFLPNVNGFCRGSILEYHRENSWLKACELHR